MNLVVKLGGAAGIDPTPLVRDIAQTCSRGVRPVLVHGGSDATTHLQERLGRPARFLRSPSGQTSRRTDREDVEAFAMATALVNRRLVERLLGEGVRAVGISGLDAGLVRGSRKSAVRSVEDGRVRIVRDQWTGRPVEVDPTPLEALRTVGCLPVVAPLMAGERGEMLNTDGDRLAAHLAAALRAETLVILTNVPGLLRDPRDEGTLVEHLPLCDLELGEALAQGRMHSKLLGAREALERGVRRVILADARVTEPLTSALEGRGTVLGEPLAQHVGGRG